ncbi:MAG: hypothetical protein LLF76_10915 [Planctomycetaceae bacterium]|nr:hypothetical protein [Planctomycetaceae bacterium]
MTHKMLLAASIFCFAVSAIGLGQGFTAGDKIFTISGIGSSTEGFEDNAFAAQAELGYFLTDAWEIDLRQAVSILDEPGSDDDWAGRTVLSLDYNFNMGCIVPFVGFNAGWQYGDVMDTCIGGPEAGLRWFVNDTTYIQLRAEYECISDKLDTGYFYSLGVGFRF